MEWWSFFRRVRRVVFGVISIVSLLWAILLSVYLAREWKHAIKAQRVIVLLMIGVNGFSSVLLYLMIVVVFRLWMDFSRTIFLFSIHLATAVPLTLLGHRFDCAVFNSSAGCSATHGVSLFVTWCIVALFVFHAVFLCVISCVPRPDSHTSPAEKLVTPPEGPEGDLEENFDPSGTNSVVSHAERVQVVPAKLVMIGRDGQPLNPPRSSWQFSRTSSLNASFVEDETSALPTLPYGASSLNGSIKGPGSPAPSYHSEDPSLPQFVQLSTRRPRPLLLNRHALDPLLQRQASTDSAMSVSTVASTSSAFSHGLDIGQFPLPPQAVVADHVRSLSSQSLPLDVVPPPLRPGTPSLRDHSRSPSVYSQSSPLTQCVACTMPSRTATLDSIHSVTLSLLFMEASEAPTMATPPQPDARQVNDGTQTSYNERSGLSRQPTLALRLPNPYDSVAGAAGAQGFPIRKLASRRNPMQNL